MTPQEQATAAASGAAATDRFRQSGKTAAVEADQARGELDDRAGLDARLQWLAAHRQQDLAVVASGDDDHLIAFSDLGAFSSCS